MTLSANQVTPLMVLSQLVKKLCTKNEIDQTVVYTPLYISLVINREIRSTIPVLYCSVCVGCVHLRFSVRHTNSLVVHFGTFNVVCSDSGCVVLV